MRFLLPSLLLLLLLVGPAWAEEGEEGLDPVSAKVKAQMEKIVRLMQENEAALLEISTGGKARPKPVDVAIDPPQGSEGSAGKDSSDKDSSDKVRKQRKGSEAIPQELEELVRMVPQ